MMKDIETANNMLCLWPLMMSYSFWLELCCVHNTLPDSSVWKVEP